jgi:hypothetical protein
MADETTNLVLEHLRHIRGVVDEMRAEMKHLCEWDWQSETLSVFT